MSDYDNGVLRERQCCLAAHGGPGDQVTTRRGRDAAEHDRPRQLAAALGAAGPRRPLPGRGLVDRRHPRADGRRRPRQHGRRRLPRALAGPALERHLRRRRPGRPLARRRAAGPRRRAGQTSSSSSSPTGSRPASRSGPRPTSARWSCRSCTSTGPRRSTTSSGPPSPTSSSPPTASGTTTTWRPGRTCWPATPCPLWLVVGDTPAADLPAARRRRSPPCSTPTRSPARSPSTPTRRRSSGSPPARPATPRASCTRTARSAARPASSTTSSPPAGRPRSPARRSVTSSACSTPSSCRCCATAAVNLIDVWDPGEVLRMMLDEGLGVGGGATYFLTSLLDHPDFTDEHLALMPFAGLGGSTVPVAVMERATRLGIKAFRSYGSTEHPSITACLIDDPEDKRLTTDGRALPGVELRLDEDGEIISRGPDCCLGYTDPDAHRLGVRRRRLVPHGRRRRARRRGLPHDHRPGVRHHHPRRREHQRPGDRGADDGRRRGRRGQRRRRPRRPARRAGGRHPAAARRRPSCPRSTTVRDHLAAAGLARQKWPESLHVVDEFPRTPSGKVQKFRLRQQLRDGGRWTGLDKRLESHSRIVRVSL